MIRYRYNQQVRPPAPFVHVSVQRPDAEGPVSDLAAQIDTGADMTVLPAAAVEQLHLVQFDAIPILAFGGITRTVPTYLVSLALRGQEPVVIEILGSADEPHALLGRDFLNRYRMLLDGRRDILEID